MEVIKRLREMRDGCDAKNTLEFDGYVKGVNDSIKLLQDQKLREHIDSVLPDENDLGVETISEPIQNALYATERFCLNQVNQLTEGILQYLDDANFKIVKK
ncbi:MAG: hypothetical protein P9L97_00320 [Candidatus Tenebribacter davisii]|nr:hypothetical protein [Candidatus Tenebribacter davisii]